MATVATFGYQNYRRVRQSHRCDLNLMQIGFAFHNYADRYGTLPPRITVNATGEPLHSWRTLILPFMERSDVYEMIDLTKRWDAPENAAAMKHAITAYQCPACANGASSCNYVAIYGSDTVLRHEKGVSLWSISDWWDHTIAITESVAGVKHWAEPSDLPLSGLNSAVNHCDSGVSSRHSDGVHCLLADASVESLPADWDATLLRQASTCSGGESIDLPWLSVRPEKQRLYDKFVERGTPYSVMSNSPPPDPPSKIGLHNFERMTIAELNSVLYDNELDAEICVSAWFHLVRATGLGRCNLSYAFHRADDNHAALYWLLEAAVREGIRESEMPIVRSVLASSRGRGEGLIYASIRFWKRTPREEPRLTLPSDYDSAEALPLIVCLHPSFSDQSFFDRSLLTRLADRFQVAVLTLDGHEPYGPNLVVWTENYHNNYADDEEVVANAIEQCSGKFTERANSRILVGFYGGAFVAFASAFSHPDKYAGAVAIYPSVQAADGVWFDQLIPNDLHASQRYSLLGDTQRWRALMASKLEAAAYTASAKVNLLSEDVETFEIAKEVSANSELAEKLMERLSWVMEDQRERE